MPNKDLKFGWLAIFCFLFFAARSAYADMGTVLMWAGVGHMIFGNFFIGIGEGVVIALVFRARVGRSILIMVLANYLSAIAGLVGLSLSGISAIASIYNILPLLIALTIGSYILTALIEWPFCFWAMKGMEKRRARSFKASVIINTISYAILIPYYLVFSSISLITQLKVDKPVSFLKTENAVIYFIDSRDRAVYKIKADGSGKQKVKDLGVTDVFYFNDLFISEKDGKTGLTALWFGKSDYSRHSQEIDIPGLPATSARGPRSMVREIVDLRPENMRDWHVAVLGLYGLRGENKKTGQSLEVALEAPFIDWGIDKATVLPEDQVICQIGNQIVLIDLETRRMGLITIGTNPVVVLEGEK